MKEQLHKDVPSWPISLALAVSIAIVGFVGYPVVRDALAAKLGPAECCSPDYP